MDFLNFISGHAMHAVPILILGAVALAIILERTQVLYMSVPMHNIDEFFKEIAKLVMSSKIKDAISLCNDHHNKPVAKITKAALSRSHLPESLIHDGIQIALAKSTQLLTKRTGFLADYCKRSYFIGAFWDNCWIDSILRSRGHADPQQKSALLAAGIATSMNATMLGLAVAIPCMLAFSFLMSRSNRLISELEESSVHIDDILKQRFYSSEFIDLSVEQGKK